MTILYGNLKMFTFFSPDYIFLVENVYQFSKNNSWNPCGLRVCIVPKASECDFLEKFLEESVDVFLNEYLKENP